MALKVNQIIIPPVRLVYGKKPYYEALVPYIKSEKEKDRVVRAVRENVYGKRGENCCCLLPEIAVDEKNGKRAFGHVVFIKNKRELFQGCCVEIVHVKEKVSLGIVVKESFPEQILGMLEDPIDVSLWKSSKETKMGFEIEREKLEKCFCCYFKKTEKDHYFCKRANCFTEKEPILFEDKLQKDRELALRLFGGARRGRRGKTA